MAMMLCHDVGCKALPTELCFVTLRTRSLGTAMHPTIYMMYNNIHIDSIQKHAHFEKTKYDVDEIRTHETHMLVTYLVAISTRSHVAQWLSG